MSYLHSPRLVFSGDFLSDVSTVNNDVTHYNIATFQPNFQEFGKGSTNGWWNPEGGAVFNFKNCIVQQVTMPNGESLSDPNADIILGQIVAGSEGRPTGKMLDLDPDAQMVSALWCVQLRICTPGNELLLRADIDPTCFRDIQLRQFSGAKVNGQPMGASWTSVLTNIVWGKKVDESPFLSELKNTTQGDKLSINLNAFGYYYNHADDGRFSLGKILGTIGPWFEDEPKTFAACRRMYGTLDLNPSPQPHNPVVAYGVSNFLFEATNKRVTLDLGNSFPISDALGSISITNTLVVGVSNQSLNNAVSSAPQTLSTDDFLLIGEVNYQKGLGWLNATGGVVAFNNLSDSVVELLTNNQLVLLSQSAKDNTQYSLLARESINGLLVRADNFVQRLDFGNTQLVDFYTYQWGNPLPDTTIQIALEPPTPNTPVSYQNPTCEIYGNNFPPYGITFQSSVTTNGKGFGQLSIQGNAIYSPRVYIDGQIYTIDYNLPIIDPAMGIENIIVHLRDYFAVPDKPIWDDIAPTMIQYANLYPIMSKYLVNLANPNDLILKKEILKFAFSRDIHDTMHMPVTRDLSDTKRNTILKWLDEPIIELTGIEQVVKNEKPSTENPVSPDTPLTNNQLKYKEAVKSKNGSMPAFPSITNLFENL
jgi:hypothetical protein